MLTSSRVAILLVKLFSLPVLLEASDPAAPPEVTGTPAPTSVNAAPAAGESRTTEVAVPHKPDLAVEKYWQAVKLLRSTKAADLAAGRAALQTASDLEFTHAQVLLANCLLAGSYGFTKDARKGANLFHLAAERGNAFAIVSLGQCLYTGTGVRKDLDKATAWLTAAVAPAADYSRPLPPPEFFATDRANKTSDNGGVAGELERDPVGESRATAHFMLGQISDLQKKPAEAQTHYVAAAGAGPNGRDGIYLAALQAALNYAFGNGVPRDLTKAHEMLSQSRKLVGRMNVSLIHNYTALKIVDEFATADLEESVDKAGDAYETELQLKIASTFADRKSKEYNLAEAVKWYAVAAESGQAWAMFSLGLIYSQSDSGLFDPAKAFYWFEKVGGGESPKLYLGTANLALCYQNGFGTAKDSEKAAALFQKYRNQDIVCYLGTLGQYSDHSVNFEQGLALNVTWAKDKNDAHAQYLLGVRYLYSYGVKFDFDEASRWLKLAAKANHAAALCELGLLYEQNGAAFGTTAWREAQKAATDCYRRASELGNVDALTNYANMLSSGRGTARDQAKAEEMLLKCLQLDPNHARAHCNLAVIYSDRLDVTLSDGSQPDAGAAEAGKWRAAMLQHYDASIRLKFPYAARNLGELYFNGKLVEKDFQRAYSYFEMAAEWGLKGMQAKLGHMHEFGQGTPVTYAEAAYHYRLAALEGDENALRRLADFYVAGKGVARDLDRAIFWISILAHKGDTQMDVRLGDLYIQNQNYEMARTLFLTLTNSDSFNFRGIANQRLSILYANGWGVVQDQKKARKYREKALRDDNLPAQHDTAMVLIAEGKKGEGIALLEKAARRGLPNSNYELGRRCLSGDGVAKDLVRGLALLKEAAAHGQVDAEVVLATLTLENAPGALDLESAIHLASAAAASGHERAAELREKLEQRRQKNLAAPDDTAKARSS